MKPRISVIIPAYNAGAYLAEAISSIRSQTYPVDEIVVVDDGSVDNTRSVVSAFDVHYIYQENRGPAFALNKGIENSTGSFLAFLDADDLWTPDRIERQIALFDSAAVDMAFGLVEQFFSPDLPVEDRTALEINTLPMQGIHKSAWLIRREAFMKVGFFTGSHLLDEFPDWYARSLEKNLMQVVVQHVIARRRIHASNTSRLNRDLKNDYPRILKAALDRRRLNGNENT